MQVAIRRNNAIGEQVNGISAFKIIIRYQALPAKVPLANLPIST